MSRRCSTHDVDAERARRRGARRVRSAGGQRLHHCRAATTTATALNRYLDQVTNDTSELNITVLTTLQCNFACDYCFQGDHGDYNKFAEKMSLETAARVGELDRARARSRPPREIRR